MTAQKQTACTLKRVNITKADLPLACPMPNMTLWHAHPRVFLPIADTGHETCPYCGTEFFLKADA